MTLAGFAGGLALAIALLATSADADVVSKAPDAVAVVVYRDQPRSAAQLRGEDGGDTSGLAMVSETRSVDLPAGRSRVRFEGVADEIIPASATLQGLPGRQVERDFDYDLLDPGSLIEHSVGQPVTVRRTNPKTGQVAEEPAVLRSGPDGVTVETAHGVEALGCGAGPQALVFDHLPEGLADKPTLSAVVEAPRAGRYTLTLSYLAVRIDWSADYVARIAADGKSLDLTGWLTLSNRSGMSFEAAPTAVVAGRLARVEPDLPDIEPKTVNAECWPMGTTSDWLRRPPEGFPDVPAPPPPAVMAEAATDAPIVVTARKRVTASDLGDYKLYALAEPTTLAARQTKQIRFLHQPRVAFETLLVFDATGQDAAGPTPAHVVLRFENKPGEGLGAPLPAGMVSIRQATEGDEYFVGEHGVRDVPVGEEFELDAGAAPDVRVQSKVTADVTVGSGDHKRERTSLAYTITNAEDRPVKFELRRSPIQQGFRVTAESRSHGLKNGRDVWRLTLPANGSATLSYTYEVGD